ncbi:type I-B CRISPR-associated protein Cas8b/Csh1 [Salarchaeum sp. III]|uniref:type I-B CRISPR-associated protein Cas8b/Csh1 n=1 Tax=Salarchaeum sp. III TaxID=3107927 RepID=UPI002EDB99C0
MLSPEAFDDRYDDSELRSELPDSPIASLRDLQYLYGKLYTLATAGGGEYAPYLTPDAAGDLVDTDDSLIVVRVDLSEDAPQLADDETGPVEVTRYTDELVAAVAHCKYPAARGIDHSITHQAGKNSDPEKLARYANERLTKWATDDVVQGAAADHEDGWIVDALAELGENETVLETIENEVERELDGESATALLTVRVKTETGGDYEWPGAVDVFQAAMRARKLSKLVSKGQATESAGDAVDLVTGEGARTVGTAEDPQNYYLGKQLEKFPGLDVDEAWRTHPVSEDAAITLMNAETFVEACTYRTFGAKVYSLPYFFGTPDPASARELYGMLYRNTEEAEMTPVELAYDERAGVADKDDDLRFYVSAVMPHQMSRYDVFGETLNGRLLYPKELAVEHNFMTRTALFESRGGWSAPLPRNEKWGLLASNDGMLDSVSTGWYFTQTFAERDDADADADDPRIEALIDVLSGDPLSVDTLLEEYVERIMADENDDQVERFPSFRVASQFAQLCALATDELDLLTTNDPGKQSITREPDYDTQTMPTLEANPIADGGNAPASKLATFIESTPALVHDEANPINDERRGAFLLGALVGEVGSYQGYSEDRSTTLIDQYPVKSITRTRVKKVAHEAIAKTVTYTRGEDRTITLFEHLVDRLRETVVRPDPDDWEIETDDLRFYYALGVTYGMNDHPDWDDDTNEDEY